MRHAVVARLTAEKAKAAAAQSAAPSPDWTVSKLVTEALDALALSGELAPSSLTVYRLHARKHLAGSELGGKVMADVRAADAALYLTALTATSGMGTARQGRAVLNRGMTFAVRLGLLDSNPLASIGELRTPREHKARKGQHLDHGRSLSKAERVALAWAVARDQRAIDLDLRDLVLAGLAIGARVGELCAVRWADITFTANGGARVALGGTVTRVTGGGLVRSEPKTRASTRTVPVARRVAALLRRRAAAAGVDVLNLSADVRPVFPTPGRWALVGESESYRDIANTSKRLREAFDRAGFDWVSFHALRRAAVTALADVLPIRVASQFAGHSSVRTTQDYYVGRDAEMDPAVADHL